MYWKIIFTLAAFCLFSTGIQAQDNIALHKPVFEVGGPFGVGAPHPGVPPDVVTDGIFLPAGDDWFNGSWWLDWECAFIPPVPPGDPAPPPEPCALEIDLQGWFQIDSFVFQGDSDAYRLQYWLEETPPSPSHWEIAWEVPIGTGFVQTRPNPADNSERWSLPEPVVTNRLRIQVNPDPLLHDGWNSVAELQAFGSPVPDPFQDGAVFDCDQYPGESFEAFLGNEAYCYKFEFECEEGVYGAFHVAVNLRDGGVGYDGYLGNAGEIMDDPSDDDFCGMNFGHLGNTRIVHACYFEAGQAAILKVKSMPGHKCTE
jgi:hypothetical protein